MSKTFIDFRDTAAFVSDPANATFCTGDAYPVTRGGFTFGWAVANTTIADRSAANIAQLAGINYEDNTLGTKTFNIDLPDGPGTYKIGAAFGDQAGAQGIQNAVFKDGATTLFTVNANHTVANDFIDATGVQLAEASWLAGQAYQTVTMAGSQLSVVIGGAASGFTCFACLYVEFIPAAAPTPMLYHSFRSAGRVRRR